MSGYDKDWLSLEETKQRARHLVQINTDNLYQEMATTAVNGCELSALLATATEQVELVEQILSQHKSSLFIELKQSSGKLSLDHIKALQELDGQTILLRRALAEAKAVKVYLESVDQKYRGRDNMLINLRKLEDAEASR